MRGSKKDSIMKCFFVMALSFELGFCTQIPFQQSHYDKAADFFHKRQCAVKSCEDPNPDCYEYCYDQRKQKQ